jgi:hypothetical protein
VVHIASFGCYLAALIHGLMSGTDTGAPWAVDFYWITGGCLLFMLIYRILTSRKKARLPAASRLPAQD